MREIVVGEAEGPPASPIMRNNATVNCGNRKCELLRRQTITIYRLK